MSYYMGDYYQGDYYRGDYYRGDPFFGAIAGLAAGPLMRLGKAVLPKAARAIFGSKVLTKGSQIITRPLGRALKGGLAVGGAVATVKTLRGGAGPLGGMPGPMQFESGGGGRSQMGMTNGGCPPGFHPCKSPDGCKMGPCVRNRRMNPANPKALRRGLRRVSGFAKLAQRTKRDIGRAATAAGVRRSAVKRKR